MGKSIASAKILIAAALAAVLFTGVRVTQAFASPEFKPYPTPRISEGNNGAHEALRGMPADD